MHDLESVVRKANDEILDLYVEKRLARDRLMSTQAVSTTRDINEEIARIEGRIQGIKSVLHAIEDLDA